MVYHGPVNMAHLPLLAVAAALPEEYVRNVLRRDAAGIALGVLFVAIGLLGMALFRLRARGKDPALLWFGVFALLFGVRMLALADTVRFATGWPEQG